MLKWFYIILGACCVVLGLLVLWLPIPLGIPLLLVGIPLLMRYSPNARRWILCLAERHPPLRKWLQRLVPVEGN